jgi:hypothetical protein
MKKTMFVGFVMAMALAACGGKNKKADTTMESKGSAAGSAAPAGGATYGAAAGSAAMPAGNPCAGKNPCGGM